MTRGNRAAHLPPGHPTGRPACQGEFLTRSRRRGGNKSKSAHSGGLLRDQLLAIGAHLALFVLEQSDRLVSGGPKQLFLADRWAGAQEHAGNTSLRAKLRLCGWQPTWGKEREVPGPCKALEDLSEQSSKRGKLPPVPHPCRVGISHTPHGLLSRATDFRPLHRATLIMDTCALISPHKAIVKASGAFYPSPVSYPSTP